MNIVRVEKCGVAQRVIENVKKKETKEGQEDPFLMYGYI